MFMDMYINFTLEYKKRLDKLKNLTGQQNPHIEKIIKGMAIVDKIVDKWTEKAKSNTSETIGLLEKNE